MQRTFLQPYFAVAGKVPNEHEVETMNVDPVELFFDISD